MVPEKPEADLSRSQLPQPLRSRGDSITTGSADAIGLLECAQGFRDLTGLQVPVGVWGYSAAK